MGTDLNELDSIACSTNLSPAETASSHSLAVLSTSQKRLKTARYNEEEKEYILEIVAKLPRHALFRTPMSSGPSSLRLQVARQRAMMVEQ